MPVRAKTRLRRRGRRSRRGPPDPARRTRSSHAGWRADLRDRPRPRPGRRGVPEAAVSLAGYRRLRGRGVLDFGRRSRLIHHGRAASAEQVKSRHVHSSKNVLEDVRMLAPSGELLRAGMALKLNHLKRATQSYLRDRTNQATGRMTSYATAAGLLAAAGLFVIAAFFVGLIALYRWVAIHYG